MWIVVWINLKVYGEHIQSFIWWVMTFSVTEKMNWTGSSSYAEVTERRVVSRVVCCVCSPRPWRVLCRVTQVWQHQRWLSDRSGLLQPDFYVGSFVPCSCALKKVNEAQHFLLGYFTLKAFQQLKGPDSFRLFKLTVIFAIILTWWLCEKYWSIIKFK